MTRGPLTDSELAAVLDRDSDILDEIVGAEQGDIVAAMATELGALRKRVAELEPCREVLERMLAGERFVGDALREMLAQTESVADRFRRFAKLRDELLEADACTDCGCHPHGRRCQCENDE